MKAHISIIMTVCMISFALSNQTFAGNSSKIIKRPTIKLRVSGGQAKLVNKPKGQIKFGYRGSSTCKSARVDLEDSNGKSLTKSSKKMSRCPHLPTRTFRVSRAMLTRAKKWCEGQVASGKKRVERRYKSNATVKAKTCRVSKKKIGKKRRKKRRCSETSSGIKYFVNVTCMKALQAQSGTDTHGGGTLTPTKPTPRKPTRRTNIR